ncbi:MAG: hypothetical protein KDA84_20855 [Planctomycetaceae bacterium]|nr:hypothetical protein [Planctomycetaceae bacterium]
MDGLDVCTPRLREIVGDGKGLFPINGITLSILPWFGQAEIAFRVQSDPPTLDVAEWEYYDDFSDLCNCHSTPLADAAQYSREAWENPPDGLSNLQMAHLIFLAGAEALLDASVRNRFYEILDSIQDESTFTGQFSFDNRLSAHDGWFDYIVSDPDGNCRANYCDVIRANEVSTEALPFWGIS